MTDLSPPPELGAVTGLTALTHNTGNAATGGIWLVTGESGSAVCKIARPPGTPRGNGWDTSDEPAHWNCWRREPTAYRTGFVHRVYADAGITGPDLLAVVDRPDGAAELWLAVAQGAPGFSWPTPRLARFARRLGAAQTRVPAPVLAESWLSRQWLRQYVARTPLWMPGPIDWDHPAGRVWPAPVRTVLRGLWEHRDRYVAAAERTPRTLCHLDVWPMNLIEGDDGRTILLDWAFTGEGALGEDLANLVVDSVADGLIEADRLPEIETACTEAYIEGLRDGGWTGDERDVRRAVAVTGAAKYSWLAAMMLHRVTTGEALGSPNYDRGRTPEAIFAERAVLVAMLARWAAVA